MFKLVDQPARRADDYVRNLAQLAGLHHHIYATYDDRGAQVEILSTKCLELFVDLVSKLSGRCDDQCKNPKRILCQFLENRQCKACSFTAACMSAAYHVAAL